MRDLSLHILDLAENAVRANARLVEVHLVEDSPADRIELQMVDDGDGMDEETRRNVLSPFCTSRLDRRVGLGLSLLVEAARAAQGRCTVESRLGEGTRVMATFRRSHIDCKPLGNLAETFRTLAVGYPQVDFVLTWKRDRAEQTIDTRELRGGRRRSKNGGRMQPPQDPPAATQHSECNRSTSMPDTAELSESNVHEIIRRWEGRDHFVIEMLQDVQHEARYLPMSALRQISQEAHVPLARLYHLATFYKGFSLKPRGEHIVHVCQGTACHVQGGVRVLEACGTHLGIHPGETTEDGEFSLEPVQCLGCCGLAAVMTVDDDLYGHVRPGKVGRLLAKYSEKTRKQEVPA